MIRIDQVVLTGILCEDQQEDAGTGDPDDIYIKIGQDQGHDKAFWKDKKFVQGDYYKINREVHYNEKICLFEKDDHGDDGLIGCVEFSDADGVNTLQHLNGSNARYIMYFLLTKEDYPTS